jgi:hypothetical protein
MRPKLQQLTVYNIECGFEMLRLIIFRTFGDCNGGKTLMMVKNFEQPPDRTADWVGGVNGGEKLLYSVTDIAVPTGLLVGLNLNLRQCRRHER